jgi:DNA-directed RNA polymerase alpha subunit
MMTIGQMLEKTSRELLQMRNMGERAVEYIKERLARLGFRLKDEEDFDQAV